MDEQLLKDLLATAEANNWNWDIVMPKFPELEGVDLQLLKDYAATAKANNYDYSAVNPKFPEFFPKKKDDSEPTSTEEPVVSVTPTQEDPGLLESSQGDTKVTVYQPYPINPQTGEKDTAIERWFGKNEITDFFGDIYRAGAQGQKQAGAVGDALTLMTSGEDATDEEIQEFLLAVQEMNNAPVSDEMKDFERVYEQQGGGVWGFIKGLAESPTVIPQLFTSSVSAMFNPASAGAAAAGAAVGSAVPIIGTMAGAIGAAGTTLETALSFAEFLQDEVKERGLDFTKDSVRKVLEDPEALSSMRRRAAGRGIAIGAVDALTAGVAGKTTSSIAKAGAKTLARRGAAATTGIGVESVGGSLGEVAGRLVAGQEMDVKEIGFEGIAGTATAPLTVGTSLYKAPKYKINGEVVSADVAIDLIKNGSVEQISQAKIEIKNDPELLNEAREKKENAKISATTDPRLSEEDRAEVVELEKRRRKLNPDVYNEKKQIKDIEAQIDAIVNKYEETGATVTEQEVLDALKEEGIDNPTIQQKIEKSDELMDQKEAAVPKQVTREEALQSLKEENAAREKMGLSVIRESEENITQQQQKLQEDAVQEQETRDIPDAEPTEAVQEVEEEVRLTPEEEAKQQTVSDLINRPVTLTELGGSKLDAPIKGDLFIEGQQVVVEDADGKIIELGNVDELSGQNASDLGIDFEVSEVSVNSQGNIQIDQVEYSIQEDLPTQGIEYNEDGTIKSVSIKKGDKPVEFRGQTATDIGYQILLKEAQSPAQEQKINELLEQDEEFQNELRQAEAAPQIDANQDIEQAVEQKQVTTTKPTDKDVVTEKVNKLRKEFWTGWNRAWRESNLDSKQKKKDLLKQIKDAVSQGQITPRQQKALLNKIANVNLDNPIARKNLVDYATNLFESAEYKAKLNKAKSLNTRIRKARKNSEATVSKSAKDFLSIDPSKVENIDEHLAIAENLLEGLRPTREALAADGTLKVREAADITAVNEYTSAAQERQAQIREAELAELFEEATGQSSDQLTVAEMKEMLATIDSETTEQTIEDKKETIKQAAKNAFEVYSEPVFASLADPSIPTKTKNLVNEFLNIDIDGLSTKQALKALDALVNFNENNTATGGMQAMVEAAKADKKAKQIASENIPSRNLNTIGKLWSKGLTTLPLLFENIFVTQKKARKVSDAMGVTQYQNDAARAERNAENFVDRYAKKFRKNQPNKKTWNDPTNIYERGMYAFMNRTVDGDVQSQENEFNRRKGLIEQSIVDLRDAGETKKADLYQQVYDKVLADATTRDQLNVDPINKESVEFFANEWAQVYPDVSDVALNVYNRALEADLNYTPDNLSRLKVDDQKTIDLNEPTFNEDYGRTRVYDKQSGTLIESQRPKRIKNRYVNLDFDSQNSMRLKEALTDVYSAATVQYMNGFINSDAYKQIIPDADTRDLLTKRIKGLVDIKRNKQFTTKYQAKLNKTLNRLATIGTGRVLGGLAQFPKQLIPPIINTVSQAGGINMLRGFGMMFNPSVNRFLDNSGMSIANRGAQSQTALESVNRKLEANLEGTGQKVLGGLAKPNEFLLKGLVKGDQIAARSSWMAYYLDGLQKQGINTDGINWDTHQMNQEAANFAQQQVDRNQNVSDPDLQGEIFTSKNPGAVFTRKAVLPFATFILNQKTRMVNDVRALTSKTSSMSERGDAARSLTGLLTEQAAFHSMGYFITNMLTELAYDLMDEFEPEEEEEKRKKNMFKGKVSTIVKDFVSPIPPLDDPTASVINAITNSIFEEENPLELFANDEKTFLQQLGTIGIAGDKASNMWEIYSIAKDGKYTDNYGKERQVPFVAQKTVQELILPYLLYNVGLLPTEAGSVIERSIKVAKKAKEKPMEIKEQNLRTTSKQESYNSATTVKDKDLTSEFKSKKGSLVSPVEQGSVKTPFGENRDQKYPNITKRNSGVDIVTEEKSNARSVSSGKVSKIQKFKDGSLAVYVRHGDYVTVYKNISNPKVKVGQIVDEEQPLGTVFTNPKTKETVLKFLVYDKDKKQNPADWVAI